MDIFRYFSLLKEDASTYKTNMCCVNVPNRGALVHVQNSVQMSEITDRKVLFERAERFEQFSSF